MRRAALISAIVTLSASAQAQVMTAARLRAVEGQVANVYAMGGTEADFTETHLRSGPPVTWSGHAVFAKNGFVLDYTVPAGRRVVSDLTVTRTIQFTPPLLLPTVREFRASESPYVVLNIFTGAFRPVFTVGQDDPSQLRCIVLADRAGYLIDLVGSRIIRINVTLSPDMHFANVRMLATPQAVAKVTAALTR